MLKTRLITGILLIGFIFWAIFSLPPQAFVFVAGVLTLGMMREWVMLIGLTNRIGRILLLDLFIVFQFLIVWFLPYTEFIFWISSLFWVCVCLLLFFAQVRNQIPKLNNTALLLIGYFSLLALFAGLVQLRGREQGALLVLMAFVIVWCADSFAYAFGRLFGKHKMIPIVSPGKTVEGLMGGMLLTLPVLGFYWIEILGQPFPDYVWAFVIVYLIMMSVVGDLFESLIKRMQGVKDSGTLLPGHGGLLDRFDSLMAVAPLLALMIIGGFL